MIGAGWWKYGLTVWKTARLNKIFDQEKPESLLPKKFVPIARERLKIASGYAIIPSLTVEKNKTPLKRPFDKGVPAVPFSFDI